jgi:hypothetical protein
MTASILAHEAAQPQPRRVHRFRRRAAVKTDGTVEAALWREAIRVAEHHPRRGDSRKPKRAGRSTRRRQVPPVRAPEGDYNKSARTAVLDYQGPDTYMYFQPPITGIDRLMPRPPAPQKKRTTVRLVAFHDSTGRMTTASVFAPQGKESELFRFKVDPSRHDPDRRVAHAGSPPVAGPGSVTTVRWCSPHTARQACRSVSPRPPSAHRSTRLPPPVSPRPRRQPLQAGRRGTTLHPHEPNAGALRQSLDPAEQTGTSDSAGPST